MPEQKTCKQCQKQFEVTDGDLAFYKKISPTFAGKTFEIPAPTLCPDCRMQRRMIWRNERALYKRKCDLCHKEIVSVYSGDKPLVVYCQECWWSDKWNPLDYGREFDSNKSFFEQLSDLQIKVPRIALANKNPENSEFCNIAGENRNCYLLVAGSWYNEDCCYGVRAAHLRNCVDIYNLSDSELCYQIVTGARLYQCRFCQNTYDSRECYFSTNLRGCDHCIFSSNLRNKSFYAYNKPCSKREFEELESKMSSHGKTNELLKKYEDLIKDSVNPPTKQINCEDCTGDDLFNCKNSKNIYDAIDFEDSKFCVIGGDSVKDCYDCFGIGLAGTQLLYDCVSTGIGSYQCGFCVGNWTVKNSYYCDTAMDSNDCFGCIGLKRENFCVLNKKYSKEKYENLVAKIIEAMKTNREWGEFFPMSLSPFGYNETAANEYYPVEKKTALDLGAKWHNKEDSAFSGEFYEPKDDINTYLEDGGERQLLLNGVIKCESTAKPFRIMPQELAFYLKSNLSIPHKHYDVRFGERFKQRNPRMLYHRQCMCEESGHGHDGRCTVEFETTYSPDRPERVYCEGCYQKSVI